MKMEQQLHRQGFVVRLFVALRIMLTANPGEQIDGQIEGWVDRHINGWITGHMDREWIDGGLVGWLNDWMAR